jgi:hypothetical protein
MPLPKSRKKLRNLFSKIKDESIKNIISEVIDIESESRSFDNHASEYRSSMKSPVKRIEEIIDNEANLIEPEVAKKGKKK